MLRLTILLFSVLLASVGLATAAFAEKLEADYLLGTWDLESSKNCSSTSSTQMIFSASGSFEYGRNGKAETVGFWSVDDDVLTLQTLSSPAFFHDLDARLKAYEDEFHHYTIVTMLVDQQKNQFTAVASLRDQMSRFTAYRCK